MLRVIENFKMEVPSTPEAFLRMLEKPTVIKIPGKDSTRTRGLGVLVHGNEPSGINALHAWLREATPPTVNLVCFVGNIAAALTPPIFTHRLLPGGRDLNRCFVPPFTGSEGEVAREVIAVMLAAKLEALIDLHNNTGRNPAYGLGTTCTREVRALSALFSPQFVYNDIALGSFSELVHDTIPALTVECGLAGDPQADQVALQGLRRYAAGETGNPDGVAVLTSSLRVRIPPSVSFAFHSHFLPTVALTLLEGLDRLNFQTLPPGTLLGWTAPDAEWPFEARDSQGKDVSREYLKVEAGVVSTKRAFIPIMITTSLPAVKVDCLFYIAGPSE